MCLGAGPKYTISKEKPSFIYTIGDGIQTTLTLTTFSYLILSNPYLKYHFFI